MLEPRAIPYDLLKPMTGGSFVEGGGAYKPKFGAIGTQPVRIFLGRSYNQQLSKETGIEVWEQEEMCEIQNDKFTKYTPRVKDLDGKQLMELGKLIQEFREQRESNDTQIIGWMVITEQERAYLVSQGIYTVEQLASFNPDTDSYRFGREGATLINKARQHMAGKESEKKKDRENEYQLLLREVAELRRKEVEREEMYLQREAAKASAESVVVAQEATKRKRKVILQEDHETRNSD